MLLHVLPTIRLIMKALSARFQSQIAPNLTNLMVPVLHATKGSF